MAFSANALELSVSGGASLTFSAYGAATTNNAWSMGDGLTFKASGETDGGLTVSTTHVIDGAAGMDDFSMSIGTESAGTIGFAGLGGSSALGAVDDVMPTAYEEPWFGGTSPTKVDLSPHFFPKCKAELDILVILPLFSNISISPP